MLFGGLLCILMLVSLPLFNVSGASWSYWAMSSEPDATPLYIPNSEIVKYANRAIIGYALMAIMGLVLYLEGRGSIELRRYMEWHSEVRATAVYSLAAIFSFVGLMSSGSLVALSFAEPIVITSIISMDRVISPAGFASTFIGIVVVLGLLILVYHSSVLSIYRGSRTDFCRGLARYGMVAAFCGLLGVFMLHSMNVMVITINFEPPVEDVDYIIPYTYADIKYLVDSGQAEEGIRQLDWNLGIMGWSLLVVGILGLGSMVGISALAQGTWTRRVRYTVSLQAFVAVFALVSLATSINAGRIVAGLGRAGLFYGVAPQIATPIVAGVVISALVLVAVFLYIRELGPDFIKDALWPSKGEDAKAPAEDVPLQEDPGSEVPAATGSQRPALSWRTIGAVAVVLVIIVATVGVVALNREGVDEGDDGQLLDISSLDQYLESTTMDLYLDEDQTRTIDVLSEVLHTDPDSSVVFVSGISATITWTDEPDERMVIAQWENQPDTFSAYLQDTMGMVGEHVESSNAHGMTGVLDIDWRMGTTVIGHGNSSLVRVTEDEVAWDDAITLMITLEDAGDQTHLVRPDRTDGGNGCRVELVVEGYLFSA
jgi:hypothetical protein